MSRAGERGLLRVVQFLPSVESSSGGPVRSTFANCRAAHAAGVDIKTVLISTRFGVEPDWEEELRQKLPRGMRLKLFPQVGHHTTNFSPALLRWVWRHAPEFDLLVLRALMHPLSSAVGWVARRRRLPYLIVPHGTLSEWTFRHRRSLLKKAYFNLVERRTLEHAVAVRFTSEDERAEARRLDFNTEVAVIPHPYESRDDSSVSPKRERGLLLFLSRLDPKKGIELLLAATAQARVERPDLRLVLAGSGSPSYEREIRGRIAELGLDEAVEMPGFVTGDAKDALLRKAEVFVLPSEEENFGIAAVEALDAGLPVVISREVDVAPRVEVYRAGIVVERSVESITKGILQVMESPERAQAMGSHGRQLVRREFAPDVVGPQILKLYLRAARTGE